MSIPASETSEFEVNLKAQQLHGLGLSEEANRNYSLAHNKFESALAVIANEAEWPAAADRDVQDARIIRDDGFTYLRQAIDSFNPSLLIPANEQLDASASKTGCQLAANSSRAENKLTSRQLKELLSEHGATISLLGRLATAERVVFGIDDSEAPEKAYANAHDNLRASNGYYLVSNSMVAARESRIAKKLPDTIKWLGRAVYGLAWTAGYDKQHLAPAVLTFGNRLRHLTTRNTAIRSVITHP